MIKCAWRGHKATAHFRLTSGDEELQFYLCRPCNRELTKIYMDYSDGVVDKRALMRAVKIRMGLPTSGAGQ